MLDRTGNLPPMPGIVPDYAAPIARRVGWARAHLGVNVKITKPGWYWLTFSTQGDTLTTTGAGPAIDDVRLTAPGSLYALAPGSPVVSIPVADPQPDTSYTPGTYPGFTIVANPQTPPGADQ